MQVYIDLVETWSCAKMMIIKSGEACVFVYLVLELSHVGKGRVYSRDRHVEQHLSAGSRQLASLFSAKLGTTQDPPPQRAVSHRHVINVRCIHTWWRSFVWLASTQQATGSLTSETIDMVNRKIATGEINHPSRT